MKDLRVRLGTLTRLAAACALGLCAGLVGAQTSAETSGGGFGGMGGTAGAASATPGSIEAPLLGGALGRSGEATNLSGGNQAQGLNNGANQALGNLNQARAAALNQTGQLGAGAQAQNQRADLGALPALGSTSFQSFVQSATGKSLPLYGYNLFERNRYPSITDVPVPANYVVGPGDELDLKIWGAVDIGIRLPVDRQGQITVPKVGPITVAGVKVGELDDYLKKQVGKVYTNFELNASVGRLRTIQIFVVGQARNPGAYTVSSLSTLISAIFESGGPASTGSMRKIELVRSGTKVASIDLYKFIQSGDTAADTRLLPGDVIVVPAAGPRVALTGAIDNQYIFELSAPQETVAQILGYSSSSTTLTTPHKMLVERVDNQKSKGPREVQERALDEAGLKSTVRDGDVITLFQISPQFANAVTLRGNVASPLRFAFKPGMKISDLIPETDALIMSDYYTSKNVLVQYESGQRISGDRAVGEARRSLPEINWDYASVERINKQDVKTTLIHFNLGKAIHQKDPQHDLQLQPGDVVTIFSVNDIPVPKEKLTQYVKVSGEVKVPGLYQIQPGETLPQLIERAGGITRNAYVYGTLFTRESTRAQQQSNIEAAVRRLEAQVSSQASTVAQNQPDTASGNSLQAQMLAQRQMLERLRNLRASGRVTLDMEHDRPQLPPLALEDGDNINVPHQPNFVGVYGAVLAETSFIHKTDLTVADYIDRAGPTREADLEAALLIRADGSVVANRANRSWLGFGHNRFLNTRMYPGDSLFIPEVIDRRTAYTQFIQGAKDWTQILYQFGIGAAAYKTLKN